MGDAVLARPLPSPGPVGSGPSTQARATSGLAWPPGPCRAGLAGWTLPGRQGQVRSRGSPQSWALGPLTLPAHAPGTNQCVTSHQAWRRRHCGFFLDHPPGGTSGHHRTDFRHPPPTARTPIAASLDPLLCNWGPQAPQPRVASKPLGAGRHTPRSWRRLLAPT